jgi:CBS-domain-containing membrane protein
MYEFLDYQAQDVMTRDPVTIAPDATLSQLEQVFEKHEFNSMPVIDADGAIQGIVTKLDLLRAFEFSDENSFPPYEEIMQRPVRSVMSREVRYVFPRTRLPRVLTRLLDTGCKSLPVLDDEKLVGMVAREDVMRGLRKAVEGQRAVNDESTV